MSLKYVKIHQVYRGNKSPYQNKNRHFLKEEIFIKRITLSSVLNDVFKVDFSTTKEDFIFCHYSFDKVFSTRIIFLKVLFLFFFLLYPLIFILCFPCRPKRTNNSFQANIKYSKIQTIPKLFFLIQTLCIGK